MNDNNSISVTTNINTTPNKGGFILEKKSKKRTVTVKLKLKTIERLDALCKESGHDRSELIKKMVEDCLENLKLEDSLKHLQSEDD